jgi:hypothetical protein
MLRRQWELGGCGGEGGQQNSNTLQKFFKKKVTLLGAYNMVKYIYRYPLTSLLKKRTDITPTP